MARHTAKSHKIRKVEILVIQMGILSIIIIVIQLVFLIGSIFLTEKALKNNFNEDGTKR